MSNSTTAPSLDELKANLKKYQKELSAAKEKDWLAHAEGIIEKLFTEFEVGGNWLTDVTELVEKYGHTVSPIGRVRNLWRVFTGKKSHISAAKRRAQNSPIQGFASEIGTAGAFLTIVECYRWLKDHDWDIEANMPQYNRAVHDSASFNVPYAFLIPFHHIRQYIATNGVTNWYKEKFDLEFTIEPEIEMEVYASEDAARKWNWELPNLLTNIYSSLQDQVKLKQLPADKLEETWEFIIKPWKNKKMREELQGQYPLLNVPGLEDNIKAALDAFVRPVPKVEEKKK